MATVQSARSRYGKLTLIVLAAWIVLPAAAITLEWNFDHGALDPANTTITNTLITLGPRNDIYGSRWLYFRASGIYGLNSQFRISDAYVAGSTLDSNYRYVYSYDQQTWYFFDNGLNDGSYYRFWNDLPFAEDVVWIAYAIPHPWAFTEAHMDAVATSPWVTPTPSADAGFVLGLSNDGTLTDAGRVVPQLNMYGYEISDPSAPGPKTVVVLTTGNHPNETTGTYVFEGFVQFVLSDDPRAAAMRAAMDFYVYPESNPDGRWAGHARTNPENPFIDHNRDWDDPVLFTDLTVLTTAMKADTSSAADYFFDFHSWHNPYTSGIWVYPEHAGIPFMTALLTQEPGLSVELGTSPPDSPGVARHWAHSPEGLNAEYTFTGEAGFIPGWPAERYMLMGEHYALALYEAIVLAGCDDPPTSGEVVFADDFDDANAWQRWALFTTSADYTDDFAYDYSANGIPPAPNSAGTTVGVKFTVNNNDAVARTEALCAYPLGTYFADDYVLKFDLWLNYNGGSGGGTGSTEFMHAGINQAGTQVNWPENSASDGFAFSVSGEGGAAEDYRAYVGPTMLTAASGVYVAGSQNQTATFYQTLFPSPEYETPGSPGKHWVEVAISQHKGVIDWRLNGTLISTRTGTSVTAGNIMIGYMDVFSSIANPAALNYVIYDNVRVEQLPETDCNGTGLADACEAIGGGDFNADGVVDGLDFGPLGECLAGPDLAPTPAEPTCVPVYRDAFDLNGDADVDLLDAAAFQVLFGSD